MTRMAHASSGFLIVKTAETCRDPEGYQPTMIMSQKNNGGGVGSAVWRGVKGMPAGNHDSMTESLAPVVCLRGFLKANYRRRISPDPETLVRMDSGFP